MKSLPLILVAGLAVIGCLPGTAAPTPASPPPRLVVLIVVDQMRGDYLARFGPHLGPGGFRRLLDHGAVYSNCHYHYAVTKTAAGHATIATGAPPARHGIIANEWIEAATQLFTLSIEDHAAPPVGAGPRTGGALSVRAGRSPHHLLAPAVGDVLKQHRPQAKVVGIANKDRAAILLAGRRADAAYWLDRGRFVSSTYYQQELPAWAERFNAVGRVEADFGATWERLLPVHVYDTVQGPDDVAAEFGGLGLTRALPKRVTGDRPEIGPLFYEAHSHTPFDQTVLTDFALATLEAEQLGRDDVPDVLAIGYSQLDRVGHAYGPDSHEVMDSLLHLDRELARLFNALDRTIGLERCLVVLTADHGVAPLPEVMLEQDPASGAARFFGPPVDERVEAALTAAFGAPPAEVLWARRDNLGYRLQPAALAAQRVSARAAAAVLRDTLAAEPLFAAVYTRDELLALPVDTAGPEPDPLRTLVRRSYHPGRGHDVVFVLKRHVVEAYPTGTNHGTPHDYDTHVPLLWLGPSIAPASHERLVSVEDIAPTLLHLLGLPAPATMHGSTLIRTR